MESLEGLLDRISGRHCVALKWFMEHAGTITAWPAPLPDGTFLTTKAKGIYKPSWTKYTLSLRQTLNSPYHDTAPVIRSDGTWSFSYFQENSNPADRDLAYTNRALIACCEDRIPIGVMRQVSIKPQIRYHIVGLALVTKWEAGYFYLEGFSPDGYSNAPDHRVGGGIKSEEAESKPVWVESYNPEEILDERLRVISSIVQRQGQYEFRVKLLETYNHRCCITDCDAVEVLEAAHIIPYLGPKTNHPANGLLVRADLHILFDLGLLAIDAETMRVIISSKLSNTVYSTISGIQLHLPEDEFARPSKKALEQHRSWAGL